MSLNYHELFKEMAAKPQVREATRKKAEKVKKFIEIRWPGVNNVSEKQLAFIDGDDDVVRITEATYTTNRPVHVVTIRNPAALDKQAKRGFVTKVIKDVK